MPSDSRPATSHLLPGTIGADGHIDPRPVIITLSAEGKVTSCRQLDGHEPPFTTPLPYLLHLPTLTFRPL